MTTIKNAVFALVFVLACAGMAFAAIPPLDGLMTPPSIVSSTVTGKTTRALSGQLCVAASSATAGTCTTSIDGTLGINSIKQITASSITITGDKFSVGGTTLSVNNGMVGIGVVPELPLQIGSRLAAAFPASTGLWITGAHTTPIRTSATNGDTNFGFYLGTTYTDEAVAILGTRQSGIDVPTLNMKGGKVGIGTQAPAAKFEVIGPIAGSAAATNTVAPQTYIGAFTGDGGFWDLRSATNHSFNVDTYNGASPITPLTILQGGNVGIGTLLPDYNLHTKGLGAVYNKIETTSADGSPVGLRIVAGSANTDWSFFTNFSAGLGAADSFGLYKNAGTAGAKMVWTNSGNVGIGATTPGSKLEVNGDVTITSTLTVAGALNTDSFRVGPSGQLTVLPYTPGFGGVMLKQGSNPAFAIFNYGGNQGFAFGKNYAYFPGYAIGDNDAIFEGNVGIGVTSPTSKLDVAGGIAGSSLTVHGETGLKTYRETVVVTTVSAANYDVGWSSGSVYDIALASSTTLTFSGANDGQSMTFFIYQSSNSKTISWPTGAIWPGGATPALSTPTAKTDIFTFVKRGGRYFGFTGGQGY